MKLALNALSILNRSGTGAYARALVDYLSRNPVEEATVHVFMPAGAEKKLMFDPSDFSFPEGVIPHFIKVGGMGSRVGRVLWESLVLPIQCRRLAIDLLHGPTGIVPSQSTCDTAVTIHDVAFRVFPEDFSWRHRFFLNRSIPRSGRTSRVVITDSEWSKLEITRHLGVPPERIEVIPLGTSERYFQPVPPDQRSAVRERYGLPESFILYVGTVEPRKNLDKLVSALPQVRARFPDYSLVIAGRLGWKTRHLLSLIESLPDSSRAVQMLGFVKEEDLPALMQACTVFAYPSKYEGFGIPPLQAMASGRPVLVSEGSSFPEVVGEDGLRVDTSDPKAIAEALIELLGDEDARHALGRLGAHRARQFTWDTCAARTFEVLRGIAVEKRE